MEFRLVSVGDEIGVARCDDGSVCCGTCEGLCLESPCIFVCLVFLGRGMRYLH